MSRSHVYDSPEQAANAWFRAGSRSLGLDNVTDFGFDAAGNVTSSTSHLPPSSDLITAYAFDSMNRLVETTLPDARASTNTYDALSRLTARTGAGSVPVNYRYVLRAAVSS